jgi:hypothetical protein
MTAARRGSAKTRAVTLVRSSRVRVWELSAGGCLVESREPLMVGAVGSLELTFDGEPRVEWFRVCRVHTHEGRRGACLVAVEFLPLRTPGRESLRAAVRSLTPAGPTTEMPLASGRSSGHAVNSDRARRSQPRRAAKTPLRCADFLEGARSRELAEPLLKSGMRARAKCVGRKKE